MDKNLYLPPSITASRIVLQAEQHLVLKLVRIGSEGIHYLRCFRTRNGRELALNRVNAGLYLWSEPVAEYAPIVLQPMRKKRYAAAAPRISTLEANAPRLWKGNAADYWRFHTLADFDAFIDWYKTL